jgi:hypothetical protein
MLHSDKKVICDLIINDKTLYFKSTVIFAIDSIKVSSIVYNKNGTNNFNKKIFIHIPSNEIANRL